jgi:hypothetical protein
MMLHLASCCHLPWETSPNKLSFASEDTLIYI